MVFFALALILASGIEGQRKGKNRRGRGGKAQIWVATNEQSEDDCEESYGEDGSGVTFIEGKLIRNSTFLEVRVYTEWGEKDSGQTCIVIGAKA